MAYVDNFKIAGSSSLTWNGTTYWPVTTWVKDGTGVDGDSRLQAAVRFLMSADSAINSNHIIAQYGWYTATGAVPPWTGSGYNQYMCIRKLNTSITSFLNESGVMQQGSFFSTLNTNQRQGYWNDGVVNTNSSSDSYKMVWVDTPYIVTDCGTQAGGVTVSSKTFYLGQSDGPLSQVSVSSSYTTPYVVSYNSSGGSGSIASVAVTSGTSITLPSSGYTKTGHTLDGWSNTLNGPKDYSTGVSVSITANKTFYAYWKAVTYTVTYKANGGVGSDMTDPKTYNVNLTLKSSGFTKAGHTLSGWNTKADGTGTNYALGGTYSANANATLYAVWTPLTYTMTYKPNGGTGSDVTQTKTYGVTAVVKNNPFTRSNYTFTGWNTNSGGTGTAYAAGSNYTANSAVTLHAQWSLNHAAPAFTNTPTITRCTSAGTVSASGTNIKVSFAYSKDASVTGVISTSSFTNCVNCKLEYSTDGGGTWTTMVTFTVDTATTSQFAAHTTTSGYAITTAFLVRITLTDNTTGTVYTATYQATVPVVAALLDMYSDTSVGLGAVAPESVPTGWTGITTLGPKWDFQMDTNGGNANDTALATAYPNAINNSGVVSLKKALVKAKDVSDATGVLPLANGGTGINATNTEYLEQVLQNSHMAYFYISSNTGWGKVASWKAASGFRHIRFSVTDARTGVSGGILDIVTAHNSNADNLQTFQWLCAAGINPDQYVVTYDGEDSDGYRSYSLHIEKTSTASRGVFLQVLQCNAQGGTLTAFTNHITLYAATTTETAPTGTASILPLMEGNTTWYGYCSTAAGTAAKVVNGCDGFALRRGAVVHCLMTTNNTVYGAITLNVNSTGAKTVYIRNLATSDKNSATWFKGAFVTFIYDGSVWMLVNDSSLACRGFTQTDRPASADIDRAGTGGIRYFLATSSMTTNKPYSDGHVIHCDWDSSAGWASQLTLPTSSGNPVQWRGHTAANTWGSWETLDSVTQNRGGKTYSEDITAATNNTGGGVGWKECKHSDGRLELWIWDWLSSNAGVTADHTLSWPSAATSFVTTTDLPTVDSISFRVCNNVSAAVSTSIKSMTVGTSIVWSRYGTNAAYRGVVCVKLSGWWR